MKRTSVGVAAAVLLFGMVASAEASFMRAPGRDWGSRQALQAHQRMPALFGLKVFQGDWDSSREKTGGETVRYPDRYKDSYRRVGHRGRMPVPEPASVVLFGAGLLAPVLLRKRTGA